MNDVITPSMPIRKVWEIEFKEAGEETDVVLYISPIIEYRVSPGYWILLETENNYISIGADGVKEHKTVPFSESAYSIMEANAYDEAAVLFVGERLLDVMPKEESYVLRFDDFCLYLKPYADGFWTDKAAQETPICGFERYIRRKCTCGGEPELMLNGLYDYFIRCSRCHVSTSGYQNLCEAFDAWNENQMETVAETGEERFAQYSDKPVQYLAFDKNSINEEMFWDCNEIILSIGNTLFAITTQRVGDDQYDFLFSEIIRYNLENFPYFARASEKEPIRFIRFEREKDADAVMRFTIGERPMLLTAYEAGIMAGISNWDTDDNWLNFECREFVKKE